MRLKQFENEIKKLPLHLREAFIYDESYEGRDYYIHGEFRIVGPNTTMRNFRSSLQPLFLNFYAKEYKRRVERASRQFAHTLDVRIESWLNKKNWGRIIKGFTIVGETIYTLTLQTNIKLEYEGEHIFYKGVLFLLRKWDGNLTYWSHTFPNIKQKCYLLHWHPHVGSSGSFCMGDGKGEYIYLWENGFFREALVLAKQALHTLNMGDAFHNWETCLNTYHRYKLLLSQLNEEVKVKTENAGEIKVKAKSLPGVRLCYHCREFQDEFPQYRLEHHPMCPVYIKKILAKNHLSHIFPMSVNKDILLYKGESCYTDKNGNIYVDGERVDSYYLNVVDGFFILGDKVYKLKL